MFRVFVYSKNSSKKVATVNNVHRVEYNDEEGLIEIFTGNENEIITFDTKVYKSTIYQN